MIDMLVVVPRELGIADVEVLVNSIGGADDARALPATRSSRTSRRRRTRSATSRSAASTRTRSASSTRRTRAIRQRVAGAPPILDFLDDADAQALRRAPAPPRRARHAVHGRPELVRGLDYYTRTLFEIKGAKAKLGAGDTLVGGGRYDDMVEELGGPKVPAIGFAAGLERLLIASEVHGAERASSTRSSRRSASAPSTPALVLARDLRARRHRCEVDARGGVAEEPAPPRERARRAHRAHPRRERDRAQGVVAAERSSRARAGEGPARRVVAVGDAARVDRRARHAGAATARRVRRVAPSRRGALALRGMAAALAAHARRGPDARRRATATTRPQAPARTAARPRPARRRRAHPATTCPARRAGAAARRRIRSAMSPEMRDAHRHRLRAAPPAPLGRDRAPVLPATTKSDRATTASACSRRSPRAHARPFDPASPRSGETAETGSASRSTASSTTSAARRTRRRRPLPARLARPRRREPRARPRARSSIAKRRTSTTTGSRRSSSRASARTAATSTSPLLLTTSHWSRDSAFTLVGPYFRDRSGTDVDMGVAPVLLPRRQRQRRRRAQVVHADPAAPLLTTRSREIDESRAHRRRPGASRSRPEARRLRRRAALLSHRGQARDGRRPRGAHDALPVLPLRARPRQVALRLPAATTAASTHDSDTMHHAALLARDDAQRLDVAHRGGPDRAALRGTTATRTSSCTPGRSLPFIYRTRRARREHDLLTPLFGRFETYGVSTTCWVFPTFTFASGRARLGDRLPSRSSTSAGTTHSSHTVVAPIFWDFASREGPHHGRLPALLALRRHHRRLGRRGRGNTLYTQKRAAGGLTGSSIPPALLVRRKPEGLLLECPLRPRRLREDRSGEVPKGPVLPDQSGRPGRPTRRLALTPPPADPTAAN